MSTDTTSSSDARQQAIELRLDAIDRALLGLLSRKDRLDLVSQIETKLREADATSLSINAELAESSRDRADARDDANKAALLCSQRRGRFAHRRRPKSRLAVSSGILGIVALALLVALPVVYFVAVMLDQELLAISLLGDYVVAVTIGGLLAVVLGVTALVILNRREGRLLGHGWAITGLCTGPLPMFVGGLVALVLGAEFLETTSVTQVYTTSTVPPPGPTYVAPSYTAASKSLPTWATRRRRRMPPSRRPPIVHIASPRRIRPVQCLPLRRLATLSAPPASQSAAIRARGQSDARPALSTGPPPRRRPLGPLAPSSGPSEASNRTELLSPQ